MAAPPPTAGPAVLLACPPRPWRRPRRPGRSPGSRGSGRRTRTPARPPRPRRRGVPWRTRPTRTTRRRRTAIPGAGRRTAPVASSASPHGRVHAPAGGHGSGRRRPPTLAFFAAFNAAPSALIATSASRSTACNASSRVPGRACLHGLPPLTISGKMTCLPAARPAPPARPGPRLTSTPRHLPPGSRAGACRRLWHPRPGRRHGPSPWSAGACRKQRRRAPPARERPARQRRQAQPFDQGHRHGRLRPAQHVAVDPHPEPQALLFCLVPGGMRPSPGLFRGWAGAAQLLYFAPARFFPHSTRPTAPSEEWVKPRARNAALQHGGFRVTPGRGEVRGDLLGSPGRAMSIEDSFDHVRQGTARRHHDVMYHCRTARLQPGCEVVSGARPGPPARSRRRPAGGRHRHRRGPRPYGPPAPWAG